jgi:hypothetical protein
MGAFGQSGHFTRKPELVNPVTGSIEARTKLGRSTQGSMRQLPSFLIVGPPRTGTSWLHEILSKRTLLPSPTKETRFFDTHFHRGVDWYRAHFPGTPGDRRMGEIGPTYFCSSEARERVAMTIPGAKIVCIFRNPVERILSLYRLKRAYGMIPWSFEQAIVKDPELMDSSRYSSNLKAWQQTMGCDKVLPTLYDDLRDRPQAYIDTLMDFIEAPRFQLSPAQVGHVHSSESMTHPKNYYRTRGATVMADWFKARRLDKVVVAVKRSPLIKLFLGGGPAFADMSRDVALSLHEHFLPEIEELESLLNRDLSAWKSSVDSAIAI